MIIFVTLLLHPMKKFVFIVLSVLCLCTAAKGQYSWFDADALPLIGKAHDGSEARYRRFPDSLQAVSRPPLWELSRNSAGMAIRFRAASSVIAARWTNNHPWGMNHMTDTAIRGLDLYTLDGGVWRFVNSGRPSDEAFTQGVIVAGMEPVEREYMLYLPLYRDITKLEIGVDSLSTVEQPKVDLPRREKPVVMYGTSILQGACASRPGMAFTNIIGRRLDREVINLGFSGNALLDMEVARLMARVDAGCYVLDYVPNASVRQIDELGEKFFYIIRNARARVPVIFVEDPIYPHSRYDRRMAREIEAKNAALRALFDDLKRRGERNIEYVSSRRMVGEDGEATIDGIHFTDLGMVRYADLMTPYVERALKK